MSFMDYLRQQAALPEHLRDQPVDESAEEMEAKRADLGRRIQEDIDANEWRNNRLSDDLYAKAVAYLSDCGYERSALTEQEATEMAAGACCRPLVSDW